ncbi:hypothetical protein LC065_20105 (plasmid) [Halobacillus litoralis]|uniref:hypothetical protein n=1 Tax=Halobacillus litoralis TaxID=45668 RepID=UPI001CFDB064|nr:hypothetical protein [Halobacillus litoralis]WLR49612.1 hypothetical protein LC065_20105 [Halobacillus litoralis]
MRPLREYMIEELDRRADEEKKKRQEKELEAEELRDEVQTLHQYTLKALRHLENNSGQLGADNATALLDHIVNDFEYRGLEKG